MKEVVTQFEVINLSVGTQVKSNPRPTSVNCKFVVISNGDHRWLVFGTVKEFAYHANLVERFCTDRQIKYQWRHGKDRVEISDNGFRIEGGGHVEIDAESKSARLSGSSKAYGSVDTAALRQWLKGRTLLEGFKVRFAN